MIFDSAGNLYGVTSQGGANQYGTIFELKPQQGGGWKESTLYNFTSNDGSPLYGLTIDKAGNLYGATDYTNSLPSPPIPFFGVVFKLSPGSDGTWSYTVLHAFPQKISIYEKTPDGDGAYPFSGLTLDADGNIYGTTTEGGAYGGGTVFEIPAGQGPNGPDKIIYSFAVDRGVYHPGYKPMGGLVFDSVGNLYGTTHEGGAYGDGKIFELLPNGDGSWTAKNLHDFGGQSYNRFTAIDGNDPQASMVFGPDGNLYGTTNNGGYHPKDPSSYGGVVFELKLH